MSKLNYKKGFTLIELLVVVAIIGILSSVVLASLNSARSKGTDASIKANLNTIRTEAEMYYDTAGHYGPGANGSDTCANSGGTMFNNNSSIKSALASITSTGQIPKCVATLNTPSATYATSWAIHVPLKTSGAGNWCVDSSGNAKTGSTIVSGVSPNILVSCQ